MTAIGGLDGKLGSPGGDCRLYIVDCIMGGDVNWVRFIKTAFGCWRLAVGRAGIGFVLHFLGFHRSAAAEIGFVLHKQGVARHLVCENWVRFA